MDYGDNTQTGTHENQKNDLPVRMLRTDNMIQYQKNNFHNGDNTTLQYDDAEDYHWGDSYDDKYNPYTNNQMSTFDERYPYETNTDYYDNASARNYTSYRMNRPHFNTPNQDEDKHVQQEIQNVSENNKQITHEMNRLRNQF